MIAAPGVKCDFWGRRRAFNMLPCYRHRCSLKWLVCSHRPLTMMTRLVWIRTFSPRGNCSRSSSIIDTTQNIRAIRAKISILFIPILFAVLSLLEVVYAAYPRIFFPPSVFLFAKDDDLDESENKSDKHH